MKDLQIGSTCIIWINPFCDDVEATIVSYDRKGRPIMRTNDDKVTLEPHEYVFPETYQIIALERMEEVVDLVHGV